MTRILKLSLAWILACALTGCEVGSASLKDHPGYAEFVYPQSDNAAPELRLSLGPRLMRMIGSLSKNDADYGGLIESLDAIELRVYPTRPDGAPLESYLADSRRHMQALGWSPLIDARQTEEEVAILVKMEDAVIRGVAILALDAGEAVFINLLGAIEAQDVQPLVREIYRDLPRQHTQL